MCLAEYLNLRTIKKKNDLIFESRPFNCTDDEIVQVAPHDLREELLDHGGLLRAAPHHCILARLEQQSERHHLEGGERGMGRGHRDPPESEESEQATTNTNRTHQY